MMRLFLFFLTINTLWAQPSLQQWLTEEEILFLQSAAENSPELLDFTHNLELSEFRGQRPEPPMTWGISASLEPGGNFTEIPDLDIDWSISLTLLNSRALQQKKIAGAENRGQQFQWEWEQQKQIYGLLILILQVSREKAFLDLSEQSLLNMKEQLDAMEALARRSRLTTSEIESVRARYSRRQAIFVRQKAQWERLSVQLQQHIMNNDTLVINEELWGKLDALFSSEILQGNLNPQRPDLLALETRSQLLDLKRKSHMGLALPKISVSAGMSGPIENYQWAGSLSLSYSGLNIYRAGKAVKENELLAKQLQEKQDAYIKVQTELLNQSITTWNFLIQEMEFSQQAELHSQKALDALQKEFRTGAVTVQDFLTAMVNHRILSEETLEVQWMIREQELYIMLLLKGYDQ